MIDEFIDDIRNIDKLADFEGGNEKQRIHLNKVVGAINGIKDAADRAAANAGGTEEFYVIDGGESVAKTFVMG